MGVKYDNLISVNAVPAGASAIGVYDETGKRIGKITLPSTMTPQAGELQYRFAALSDVHVVYDTAEEDLRRALAYCNANVDFVCVCGDLTDKGTEEELTLYKTVTDACLTNIPIYAIAGNHEHYADTSGSYLEMYTGQSLYYTFEQGDDLFIMLGVVSGTEGAIFAEGELQWLYDTLENNRHKKRIFVFEHILAEESSGDILNIYPWTKLTTSTEAAVFKSLLKHYPNIVWFHGHSHMMFELQKHGEQANVDKVFGCHSVHIPSQAIPRTVNNEGTGLETYYAGSEGYIVNVYDNGVMLQGVDFIAGKFLPMATYWQKNMWAEVAAGTYADPTGTIDTTAANGSENVALMFNDGYEVDASASSATYGELLSKSNYTTSDLVRFEDGYQYTVYGTSVGGFSLYPQWYNANGGYIGTGKIADGYGWGSSDTGDKVWAINPPVGVGAMRLQGYTGSAVGVMQSKVSARRLIDAEKTYGYEITWYKGDKLSKTDGSVEATGTNYSASDYISLEGKTFTLHSSTVAYTSCSLVFYDANKTFVSYVQNVLDSGVTDVIDYAITPPEGAAYMKLRIYTVATTSDDGSYTYGDRYKLYYLTEA